MKGSPAWAAVQCHNAYIACDLKRQSSPRPDRHVRHTEVSMSQTRPSRRRNSRSGQRTKKTGTSRYTVGLVPRVALEVERYAQTVDASMSKAIASLVQIGLESQERRNQDLRDRLQSNLNQTDPAQEDRLTGEFRDLILGR